MNNLRKTVADCQVLWKNVLDVVKSSTNEAIFKSFFSVVHPLSFDNNRFVIKVDSPLVADWIKQKYVSVIENSLTKSAGTNIQLIIQCDGFDVETNSTPEVKSQKRSSTQGKKIISSNLNPNFIFKNFIIGNSNQMAHAAAYACGQNPGHSYNPLFIYGGVGLGKTHLMQAIGHSVLDKNKSLNVLYTSCELFLNQYIEAIQNRTLTKFRDYYRLNVDVLLVDDIQFLSGKDRMQEEFFHTFNTLHNEGKQIVMTCDKSPQELKSIENRLINRFEWGMVVDIQSPDFETRVAIIHKKLEQFGQKFDDDICYYLANKVRNDVRKIEGAIIKLLGYASIQNEPVNLDMAKEVLKNYVSTHMVTLDLIQKSVSEFFDLRINDLKSSRRPKAISHPRQLAMYLCRNLTNCSLTEIAQSFGGKDHTTVLYACRKIEDLKSKDDIIKQQLNTLEKSIVGNVK